MLFRAHFETTYRRISALLMHWSYVFFALTHRYVYLHLPSGQNGEISSLSVAVGPVAPPVASGAVLTGADFKQCGGNPISSMMGLGMSMTCNADTTGRYMYVYNNLQTPTNIRICDVYIEGTIKTGRY